MNYEIYRARVDFLKKRTCETRFKFPSVKT